MAEGMSPLEVMAKAFWESHPEDVPPWENLTQDSRDDDMRRMRLVLLALAEAELPYATSMNGLQSYEDAAIAKGGSMLQGVDAAFRDMLRAIANDGRKE